MPTRWHVAGDHRLGRRRLGDPALELAQVPIAAMPFVVAGYESEAPGRLGDQVEARMIWDKPGYVLEAWSDTRLLIELRRFLRPVDKRWRVVPGSG